MNKNIISQLNIEYAQKKDLAESRLIFLKEELEKKLPEIKLISKELASLTLNYCKNIVGADETYSSQLNAEYRDASSNLISKKNKILKDAGIDDGYYDSCYECLVCKDSGYISIGNRVKECKCYTQKKLEALFGKSNFPLLKAQTFEKFDISLYSDDEAAKKNILEIKAECEKFVSKFTSGASKNLLFSGSPGLGKTFLSGCIANEIIELGFSVLYLPASEMLNIMSRHNFFQFNDGVNNEYDDFKYNFIFDCNLLIIDDLGTEVISESKYSSILSVLDSRFAADSARICKTIISTNLGISDIFERYTERVGSRIVGNFDILGFRGDDLRLKRR